MATERYPKRLSNMTKADHYRYILRELNMIRYDLACLTGSTRDALVRMVDDLEIGVATRAEYEQHKEERYGSRD